MDEPSPIPGPPRKEVSSTLDVLLAVVALAAQTLSTRALLLLSLIGAFVLAFQAMTLQTLPGLEVLVAYCLLTVVPVTILEIRGKS